MTVRFACAVAAALALAGAARASEPALSYTGVAQPLNNAPYTLGWEFQIATAISIDGLGVLDATGAGLADSHQVGLWDASGNLDAFGVVAAGAADPLVANFRYVGVAPVTLAPGQYYIGALYVDGADPLAFPGGGGSSLSTLPGITYLQATYQGGASLNDPTNGLGAPGYFGPNFTVVPEPAAWALMILGLGMTGLGLRRRPLAAA